jgi:copper chaperone CopZ
MSRKGGRMEYYMHDVPGRLRVKTPLIKGKEGLAKHVENFLGQVNGVQSVLANTVTGSIVLIYDEKKVTSQILLDILKTRGFFDSSKAITNDQYIHRTASKAGHVLYKAVFGAFVESALQGSSLSLLTFLI